MNLAVIVVVALRNCRERVCDGNLMAKFCEMSFSRKV
jgi:hypothetical protein